VTLEVARKLGVPNLYLVMNKLLPEFDFDDFRRQLEETYQCQVGAILPLSTEMIRLASSGLFILKAPEHLFSKSIRELADQVLNV
jgi:MinD-like ATPase involved in chromosome partitioning or flagellar assembly